MDSKTYKILTVLEPIGVATPYNISNTLLEMYPGVNTMDEIQVMGAWYQSNNLLNDLQKRGLIVIKNQQNNLAVGNATDGYSWYNTNQCIVEITGKGIEILDEEKNKSINQRLAESVINTNESIITTNSSTIEAHAATKGSYTFQKRYLNRSLWIAVISASFILVTIYQSFSNKTDRRLQDIQTTLQKQVQTLQDIRTYLQNLDSSKRIFPKHTLPAK